MSLPLLHQRSPSSDSLLPTPPSLLISQNPLLALPFLNQPHLNSRPKRPSDLALFARPPPPSKRPRRIRPAPQLPLSTRSHSSASSSLSGSLSSPDSIGRHPSPDSDGLAPALPRLPPTPLTPVELVQSPTLGRVFGRANGVFVQVAASATGLVEAELPTANRLAELVDVLRGDLASRAWIEVIQRFAGHDPAEGDESHYGVLSRTAEIVEGLFIAPYPVSLPALASPDEPPSLAKRPDTTSTTTTTSTETLSPEAQKIAFADAVLTLTRFLGDLRDYRDRLVEIRNGCLAVEKRRRALWAIVKVCAKSFEERCGGSKRATGKGSDDEDEEAGGCESSVGDFKKTTTGLGIGLSNGDHSKKLHGTSTGISNSIGFSNNNGTLNSLPNLHNGILSTGSNSLQRSSKGKSRQTSDR